MFYDLINHLRNTCPVDIRIESLYGKYGCFHPVHNYIIVDYTFSVSKEKCPVYVLFHELAHMTGVSKHAKRIQVMKNEICMSFVSDEEYRKEEAIADLVAIKLLDHFNLLTDLSLTSHNEYMFWLSNTIDVTEDVQKAFEYILKNWLVGFEIKKAA